MRRYPSPDSSALRGSALLSVVIFTSVMLMLIAGILNWGMTERRLNRRNELRLSARNAAEALAEYGFSQIRQKFETRSTFSLNPAGSDALGLPPSTFWTDSLVVTASNELLGGTIEQVPANGASYYVDPNDPNNEFDPLKGKHVFRRDVRVIAKAIVSDGTGKPLTSYVTERISVRGAPLFAHAIFYNMDLEIFNGPAMTISGPVHTNGNLYVYPQTGTLAFTDQVTATGNVYHAGKPGDASGDGTGASARTASVTFPNKSGSAVALKGAIVQNGTAVWRDSTLGTGTSGTLWDGFRSSTSQTWNGNLQTSAHGVANYTPVAIGAYQEDPTPTNGVDNSVNSGRTIIEPSNYPVATDPDYQRKMEVEQQKYANNAGIYIRVNPITQGITVTSRNKEDSAKNKVLTLPAAATRKLVEYKAYKATSTYNTTAINTTYAVGSKITSGTNKNKYPVTKTVTTTVTPYTTTITSGGSATAPGTAGSSSSDSTTYSTSASPPASSSSSSSSTPTSPTLAADNKGMYDQHRQKGIDIIELDVLALKDVVTEMQKATGAQDPAKALGDLTTADWTGIVYVEVSGGPTTDPITGATNAAPTANTMQTGLRIINGAGRVPSYVGTNSSEGLTIATNVPVYIKGNFNADGTTSTTSPNSATTPETGETPAAIVGDAITILSTGFSDSASLSMVKQNNATSTIEISAALLNGLAPSNKNGNGKSSGGAHNLPRFLENWDNKTTFIRGSLVALFESRIFTEPHGTSDYYSPPLRNWGFNSMFRDGRYPPGTPRVMSYRRVDFTDLTAAQYEAIKNGFSWE